MSNFRPFFNFSQICQKLCMQTAIRVKNTVQYFFSPICVSYSRNNVTMQITVFFIAYTKKSTMLSLRVLIIRGLQITLRLLSPTLGNTVLLHTLFLEYETQIGEKKILDSVFQSNCSSHA